MEDEPSAPGNSNQTDADGKWLPVNSDGTKTPEETEISEDGANRPLKIFRTIFRPLLWLIGWLDSHDGAVTAAATIAIAVLTYFIAHDGKQQMEAIRGQLGEMKAQRLATIAQSRANMRRERPTINAVKLDGSLAHGADHVAGWIISPKWTNAGSTDARDWRAWFDLESFGAPRVPYHMSKQDCPPSVAPDPLPDGQTIPNGGGELELAKRFSMDDALAYTNTEHPKYTLIWGHAEYRDIFFPETVSHYNDWCESISPNDLNPDRFSFIVLSEKIE
jgi:hypothetical protein